MKHPPPAALVIFPGDCSADNSVVGGRELNPLIARLLDTQSGQNVIARVSTSPDFLPIGGNDTLRFESSAPFSAALCLSNSAMEDVYQSRENPKGEAPCPYRDH